MKTLKRISIKLLPFIFFAVALLTISAQSHKSTSESKGFITSDVISEIENFTDNLDSIPAKESKHDYLDITNKKKQIKHECCR